MSKQRITANCPSVTIASVIGILKNFEHAATKRWYNEIQLLLYPIHIRYISHVRIYAVVFHTYTHRTSTVLLHITYTDTWICLLSYLFVIFSLKNK